MRAANLDEIKGALERDEVCLNRLGIPRAREF